MREFQEKRKIRKVLTVWPIVAAAGIAALWFFSAAVKEYFILRAAEDRRLAIETELSAVRNKIGLKEGEIAELASDHGLEKIIRERFNVSKPGEEVIVIVDDKSASGTHPARKEQDFWASFVAMIKNIF